MSNAIGTRLTKSIAVKHCIQISRRLKSPCFRHDRVNDDPPTCITQQWCFQSETPPNHIHDSASMLYRPNACFRNPRSPHISCLNLLSHRIGSLCQLLTSSGLHNSVSVTICALAATKWAQSAQNESKNEIKIPTRHCSSVAVTTAVSPFPTGSSVNTVHIPVIAGGDAIACAVSAIVFSPISRCYTSNQK